MQHYRLIKHGVFAMVVLRIALLLMVGTALPSTEAFIRPSSIASRSCGSGNKNAFHLPLEIRKPIPKIMRPLEASPLSILPTSPLGSIAILVAIVLVHESGHYLAARKFGIKVEEFSVGVGPKIFGFEAFGNQFNLRALPLGGYVRFPEHFGPPKVKEEPPKAKFTWSPRKEQPAKEPPKTNEMVYYDDPDLLQNRSWKQRAVVLSGGIIFNFILSFMIYFGVISWGSGLPSPSFGAGAKVSAAPRPSSAAASGALRQGDIILAVDGRPLVASSSPSYLDAQRGINDFVATVRGTPDGGSLNLRVLHPGEADPVSIVVMPQKALGADYQTIGVLLTPNFEKTESLRSTNPIEAAQIAASYSADLIAGTASGLASVVGRAVEGQDLGGQISGPIGLIKSGSEIVSTQDLTAVLLFTAAISINLGVVNAFPLPALDGGQLIFVMWEALSGRKVNQELQDGITGATLLLLLFISLGTVVGDVESILLRRN